MKRILILMATAAVAAAVASPSLAQTTVSSAKLQLRKTSIGTILVDAHGFTLYAFTKDGRAKNSCATISGCRAIWPFVTTSGKPLVGPGGKSSLSGAIVRDANFAGANLDGADFRGAVGLTVSQICAARWRGALLDPDVQAGAQARCSASQPAMVGPQRP